MFASEELKADKEVWCAAVVLGGAQGGQGGGARRRGAERACAGMVLEGAQGGLGEAHGRQRRDARRCGAKWKRFEMRLGGAQGQYGGRSSRRGAERGFEMAGCANMCSHQLSANTPSSSSSWPQSPAECHRPRMRVPPRPTRTWPPRAASSACSTRTALTLRCT